MPFTPRSIAGLTALVAATALMPVASGAQAQAPAAQPAAPKLDLSKPFRTAIAPSQEALAAKDYAAANAAVAAARPLAKNTDERYILDRVALDIAIAQGDKAAQNQAMTAVLASGGAPAREQAIFNASLAADAYNAKDFAAASRYAQAAKAAGSTDPNLDLINAQVLAGQENYPAAIQSFQALIAADKAAGRTPPESYYNRVAQYAYKAGDKAVLNTALADWVRAYPSSKTWHDVVLTSLAAGDFAGDQEAQLDHYRLLRAANALTSADDWRSYVELASYANLNGEVVSVVDAGTAAGTLNAADVQEAYSRAKSKVQADRASLVGEAKAAPAKAQAKPVTAVADALAGYGDYAAAIPLYQAALTKSGVDANLVNTRLGIAQLMEGDRAAAKATFDKVTGSRQALANYWSLWADQRAGA